jgi:hypothetical protein
VDSLDPIPCPVLRTLIAEGMLPLDSSRRVGLGALYRSMRSLGLDPGSSAFLAGVAWLVTGRGSRCDLFRLHHSVLDHNGDSQVLRDQFRPECLQRLLEQPLTLKGLGEFQEQQLVQEPGLRGWMFGSAEFVGLVHIFGDGRSLTPEAVRSLYQHHRFPPGWRPRRQSPARLLLDFLRFAWRKL